MKLSIIVPVYNMAADGKLNYCMDSLLQQTISDYEIIAVDDASTDQSLKILRDYEIKYPERVRVIASPENRKQGGAKNLGLAAASGDWIGFMDSDDWAAPDMFEKLLHKADETGADVVGCDYNLVTSHTMQVGSIVKNNSLDQTGQLTGEQYGKLILRSGSMVIKIYQAQVIRSNQLNFPEYIFYEDNCAGPLWMLYFKHFEKVEEPLYYYYQHQTSTVHTITKQRCKDRMSAASLFLSECRVRGFIETYKDEIEYRYTELFYVNTLFSYVSGVKKQNLFQKISFLSEMKKEVSRQFPEFMKNPYYQTLVGQEEKKLIRLLGESTVLFLAYYTALKQYRKIRKSLQA